MEFINDNNKSEIKSFLLSVDVLALKDPSIIDVIVTDEVLKILIAKTDNRMQELLESYFKNVNRVQALTFANGLSSEIKLSKDVLSVVSRDIRASYSLYKTYDKIAEFRSIKVRTTTKMDVVETVLADNGLLAKPRNL